MICAGLDSQVRLNSEDHLWSWFDRAFMECTITINQIETIDPNFLVFFCRFSVIVKAAPHNPQSDR